MSIAKTNQSGQAALADSLYFLMIVSGLSTFLLFFAVSYGGPVRENLNQGYWSEYATSALRTILYSSTPRIMGEDLETATEIDFLLAVIKEDFADNEKFDYVNGLIVSNVVGLMEPVADSFDYIFYIYLPEQGKFPFFMLYRSEWGTPVGNASGTGVTVNQGIDIVFLCEPSKLDDLDLLLTNVGHLYQSDSRMQLPIVKAGGGSGYVPIPAQVNLSMWIPTEMPEEGGTDVLDASHLKCSCFKKLEKDGSGNFKWGNC